jgi:hypothetical protein
MRGLGLTVEVGPSPSLVLAAVLTALAGLAFEGCGPTKVTTVTAPDIEKYRVKSVAVMPFEALATPQVIDQRDTTLPSPPGALKSDISLGVPSTAERINQPTATVPAVAAEKVTQFVYVRLQQGSRLLVLPPWETTVVLTALERLEPGVSRERLAKRLADRMSADAVLVGRVLVYQERDGGKWGGNPATVGFEVKLVGADGKVLWIGNYYEKQRPMIEDLAGFVERGGVFVTAEELAQYGADHVVEQFPFGTSDSR